MTLPVFPNRITAADINVELGRSSNARFSINGAEERALAQVPSGRIAFSDFHGKSRGSLIGVTIAESGSLYGYHELFGYGAINPNTHEGYTIYSVAENTSNNSFSIVLQGINIPITVIGTITFQSGLRIFSGDANYNPNLGGRTQWAWVGAQFTPGWGSRVGQTRDMLLQTS